MRFILASGSPRRKEFMERLCIPYEVITSDVDESTATMGSPYERVKTLAEMKAKAVAERKNQRNKFKSFFHSFYIRFIKRYNISL